MAIMVVMVVVVVELGFFFYIRLKNMMKPVDQNGIVCNDEEDRMEQFIASAHIHSHIHISFLGSVRPSVLVVVVLVCRFFGSCASLVNIEFVCAMLRRG